MKRTARMLLIALLLLAGGAIVNIAVAWGCAALIHPQTFRKSSCAWEDDETTRWEIFVWSTPASQGISLWSLRSDAYFNFDGTDDFDVEPMRDVSSLIPTWCDFRPQPAPPGVRDALGYGCPMIALWYELDWNSITGVTWEGAFGWREGSWGPPTATRGFLHPKLLPLRAAWPGFAINTLFYGVILWGVFFIPKHTRRAIRRRRGQCPACAYPRGAPGSGSSGGSVCTECGAAFAR